MPGYEYDGNETRKLRINGALALFFFSNPEANDLNENNQGWECGMQLDFEACRSIWSWSAGWIAKVRSTTCLEFGASIYRSQIKLFRGLRGHGKPAFKPGSVVFIIIYDNGWLPNHYTHCFPVLFVQHRVAGTCAGNASHGIRLMPDSSARSKHGEKTSFVCLRCSSSLLNYMECIWEAFRYTSDMDILHHLPSWLPKSPQVTQPLSMLQLNHCPHTCWLLEGIARPMPARRRNLFKVRNKFQKRERIAGLFFGLPWEPCNWFQLNFICQYSRGHPKIVSG